MLVATKLHIPRPRTALVTRARLIDRLNDGLHRALTLMTAPAGYGKTTLLSEWAMKSQFPVSWISLDPGDNDRIRFWTYTIAALKQAYPTFEEQAVLRHAADDASGDSLIAALVNELHRVSQTIILIWDDFHHIEEPSILSGFEYLLERLPSHVHLYIASRYSPSLSLSRLMVRNELNRLEASDLRFISEETAQFFEKCAGVALSGEYAAAVQERTEGWVAAMCLAVLTLREHTDPAVLVDKMSGVERDISDYFFEEVLSRQPDDSQRFLLRASILQRMTGELCQEVTGIGESAGMLQRLEQEGMFLVPLDERREWYRFHQLFQQFLEKQLLIREPQQWKALHLTAGRWMEENGLFYEAVEHYLAGSSFDDALVLLEKIAPELMVNEWKTLCTWLNAIPDELLLAKPMMYATKLASQYLAGQVDEATDGYWQGVRKLEEGDLALPSEDIRLLQGGLAFLAAFRTFMDRDFEYAVQYSKAYMEKCPQGDLFIGFGSDRNGNHPVWSIYVSDESLRLAEQILTPLLSIWSESRNVYFIAHLCIDFGKLQYEWNNLDEAEHYMRRARDIGTSYANVALTTTAALWLARIAAARGDWQTADAIVREVSEQATHGDNHHLSGKIAWFEAVIDRMHGDVIPAGYRPGISRLRPGDEIPLTMIGEYDLLACLLAEEGRTGEAVSLMEKLILRASRAGRQSDKIRLLVHKSRILYLHGSLAQSMDILEEALALARPEGYIRTFVDEGAALGQLLDQYIRLRQNQHRRPAKQVPFPYVKRLRRLILQTEGRHGGLPFQEGEVFPLTAKEQSVLQLMETGMSNKEIARELNVSLSTVKTHINNLYDKLQVKSRLQALERARTLDLF